MQNKPTKDHRHHQEGLEELKREAVSAYRETHQLARDTVASAWETGKLLTEIKSRLNHGEWLPWLESAGIPQRTANDWMRISQISSAANLTSIRAALKEASFLSDLERIWPNYRDHWPLIEPRIQAGQRDPEELIEDHFAYLTLLAEFERRWPESFKSEGDGIVVLVDVRRAEEYPDPNGMPPDWTDALAWIYDLDKDAQG